MEGAGQGVAGDGGAGEAEVAVAEGEPQAGVIRALADHR